MARRTHTLATTDKGMIMSNKSAIDGQRRQAPIEHRDDTPEYPLAAPIKPDDPERRSAQSRAETDGCVGEAEPSSAERNKTS